MSDRYDEMALSLMTEVANRGLNCSFSAAAATEMARLVAALLRREATRHGPQRWGEADGRVLQIVSEWDMDDLAQVDDIEDHVRLSLADLPAQVAAAYQQFIQQKGGG